MWPFYRQDLWSQAVWPCRSGEVSSARWGLCLSFSSLPPFKQNHSDSGLEIKAWHWSLWNGRKVSGGKQQFRFPGFLMGAMTLERSDCRSFPCTLTSLFRVLVISHLPQTCSLQMLAMWFDGSTTLVSIHAGVSCDSVLTTVVLCISTNDLCRIFLLYWLGLTVNNVWKFLKKRKKMSDPLRCVYVFWSLCGFTFS